MPASPRSTISLPAPRIAQLNLIAERRQLPNPAAVIDAWIGEAIERGEIPSGAPGFMCFLDDDGAIIQLAGLMLPIIKRDRARLLAAILSAAAGEKDPELPMTMPAGRPLLIDLGPVSLAVGRAGRGLRFVVKEKGAAEGSGVRLATSSVFVAELAKEIRGELAHERAGAH